MKYRLISMIILQTLCQEYLNTNVLFTLQVKIEIEGLSPSYDFLLVQMQAS